MKKKTLFLDLKSLKIINNFYTHWISLEYFNVTNGHVDSNKILIIF